MIPGSESIAMNRRELLYGLGAPIHRCDHERQEPSSRWFRRRAPTLPGARKDFQVFKIGLLIATLKGCSPAPSSASCPRSALWAGRYYVLPSFGVGIPVKVNIDSEGSRTAFRGVFKESPGATSSRSPRPRLASTTTFARGCSHALLSATLRERPIRHPCSADCSGPVCGYRR